LTDLGAAVIVGRAGFVHVHVRCHAITRGNRGGSTRVAASCIPTSIRVRAITPQARGLWLRARC